MENNTITDLLQNKRTGPISELKRGFRKQIIGLSIAVVFVSLLFFQFREGEMANWLFLFFLFVWLITDIYFIYNYQVVAHLNEMEKPTLETAITKLEKSFSWRLKFILLTDLLMVIYLELRMHYFTDTGMESWMHQSIFIRLLAYAVSLAVLYFIARSMLYIKYGKHISYLKELVSQMQ